MMAMQLPPRIPAALYLTAPDRDRRLKLLAVEGDLAAADGPRFGDALTTAIGEGADGIVVDLRGCHSVASACARALTGAAATLRRGGGRGVFLVVDRNRPLKHRLSVVTDGSALPTFETAGAAVLSLREIP
jgi:anti-anti-sigma regulatory factor